MIDMLGWRYGTHSRSLVDMLPMRVRGRWLITSTAAMPTALNPLEGHAG